MEIDMTITSVPNALQYWRKQRGLTQVELAGKLGIKPLFISLWENGHSLPTHEQMVRLSEILDRPITQLFGAM